MHATGVRTTVSERVSFRQRQYGSVLARTRGHRVSRLISSSRQAFTDGRAPLEPARWWAHLVGAPRVHPHKHAPTILRKKMEDEPEASASRIKILAMLDIAQQRPAAGRPHQIEERANAPLTFASRRFRRIWARKS